MNDRKEIPEADRVPGAAQKDLQDLRAIREARGLTLDDIFARTRVSIANLQALESGDFDRLPPPVYARSFIHKYAQALGIDEGPILAWHEQHLAGRTPPREETEVRRPWPENGRRYRFLFTSLGAVVAAGILVYAAFLYDQSGKAPAPPAEPGPALQQDAPATQPAAPAQPAPAEPSQPGAAVAPQPAPALPSQPGAAALPQPVPAARPQPATAGTQPAAAFGKMQHLIIEARELTWVRITEDRNPSYQTLLKPGDRIERMASDVFLLDIGNAGGINLTFQGKNIGSLGKRGQIVHVRLPEQASQGQ